MIQYIVECIAFQLLFLIVYDLFLRRETFFQWNRAYLIATYVLSLLLPWIRIDAFKNTVPEHIMSYPEIWMNVDTLVNSTTVESAVEATTPISWWNVLFYAGMVLATLIFLIKVTQLYRLRNKGEVTYFKEFTRVLVSKSNTAFSFFRTIFLGDRILESERQNIVEHELVHIKQRHSLDLLFFELLRIVNWFNPLVYVYQSRISELHEFIADAQVAKTRKKEQYQLLLSQVFQTEKISFINHFFKSSLIKKRIVMLQKSRSKKIWGAKYLLLVPMVLCILFYTSSKGQEKEVYQQEQTKSDAKPVYEANNQTYLEEEQSVEEKSTYKNVISTIQQDSNEIPFSVVDKVPVFPGCADATDKKACFREKIQQHIRDNFRYPLSAQKQGIHGRVSVMFTIMEDGSISNIRMRGPNKILEKEAARIIMELPKMKAGEHKGKKVRVPFSVPITFKLGGDDNDSEQLTKKELYEYLLSVGKEKKNNSNNGVNNPEVNKRLDSITKLIKESFEKLDKEAREKADYGDDVPFSVIDNVPVFPGCEDASDKKACFNEMIQKHIRTHFRYPKSAEQQGIQGRVSIMFTIGEEGDIGNIRMRGPSKILEQEAARIIGELPKMIPGKQKGKNVNVPFSVPITFKLQNTMGDSNGGIPFSSAEKAPVFSGCENSEDKQSCFTQMLNKHIRKNFKYPTSAAKANEEGVVHVVFTIDESGKVDVLKSRGPHQSLVTEAERIISKIPDMRPGEHKGKTVKVQYMAPITFKLSSSIESEVRTKNNIDQMMVIATTQTKNGTRYISGKVTNGKLGLPGVNITILGTNKGAVTNFDGEFTLEVKKGDVINFQYIGFSNGKIKITDKKKYQTKTKK